MTPPKQQVDVNQLLIAFQAARNEANETTQAYNRGMQVIEMLVARVNKLETFLKENNLTMPDEAPDNVTPMSK